MTEASTKRLRRDGSQQERLDGSSGFTAFNMDDENEEGHFDDNGNYVWKKEEKHVQEEAWLGGLSEAQMEAARSARERKEYRNEAETEDMTEEQANRTLVKLLQSRETVLQALQRLGSKRSKQRGSKRKQAGADKNTHVQTAEEKEQFERVTEAADFLMRIGEVDVYNQIKEEFMPEEELVAQRQQANRHRPNAAPLSSAMANRGSYFGSTDTSTQRVEDEGKSEENPPQAAKEEVMWEYKSADGQVHGPFPTSNFIAWQQQGYFVGESAVQMRRVGKSVKTTSSTSSVATKPALSAEEELLNDFEDSDEDEKTEEQPSAATDDDDCSWKLSDAIDFASYQ